MTNADTPSSIDEVDDYLNPHCHSCGSTNDDCIPAVDEAVNKMSVVFPDMLRLLPTGTPGGERRAVIAQIPRANRKLARSEMILTGFGKSGGNTDDNLPYRFGPSDLRMPKALHDWLRIDYFQVTMDAQTFVNLNDGILTVRGFPWDTPVDVYEPFMSKRTLIQYWFDDLSVARLGHTILKLEPADKPNIRITCPNWVSPWGCDSDLSDYQMESCPPGTVTIGFLRPMRRDNLGNGYWRQYSTLPTK